MADDKDFAHAVVKSEKPSDEDLFQNDGNFMKNYLRSQAEAKQAESAIKKEHKKVVGPPIKKSRFTSMFNQMKKTMPAAMSGNKRNKACFRNDDSSDEDEGHSPKKSASTSATVMPNNASLLRGVPMLSSQQSSQTQHTTTNHSTMQGTVSASNKVQGTTTQKPRKKKSRWGEKIELAEVAPPGIAVLPGMQAAPAVPSVVPNLGLPQAYRPPGLVGVSTLSAEQKKQLEEQREMQAMYNLVMANRNAQAVSAQIAKQANKKNKHAYDSDEDIDEDQGTWEHQNRRLEMERTKELAEKLTNESDGKHFIGDFLPPEELERFMETFKALKEGRTPDFSDYKDFKIQCDNVGFKMLQKMGWSEGEGLGSEKQGITAPVNKGQQSIEGRGVGVERPDSLKGEDDEFSAYRKRMMLAYRFRPNPLNNPRRPYY